MSEVVTPSFTPDKKPPGRATLMDVAKIAGVSKVAASVVLHSSSDSKTRVRVSDATRQRILDAAKELRYQPNVLARSLRHHTTNVLGFYSAHGYVFDPVVPFYGTLLRGLLKGCNDYRKNLMMHGTFHDISEDDIYQELLNGQIDGLILYVRERTPLIDRLVESQLPVITIVDSIKGLACVNVDEQMGGRLLAHYLSEKGYRDVLYGVSDDVVPKPIDHRYRCFKTEAEARGLNVELCNMGINGSIIPEMIEQRLCSTPRNYQAIVCFNDFIAEQLCALCDQHRIRVPEDIAILGFDGSDCFIRPAVKITTIRASWDEIARKAVELLVARCKGESVPFITHMPVELVVGDTA